MKACNDDDAATKCDFFKGMHTDLTEKFENEIYDIEELKSEGRAKKFCPYFHSRRIKDVADVLLLPYNYLLHMAAFPAFNIELSNSIVIFDGAHNVQTTAEEGSSYTLSISHLEQVG